MRKEYVEISNKIQLIIDTDETSREKADRITNEIFVPKLEDIRAEYENLQFLSSHGSIPN